VQTISTLPPGQGIPSGTSTAEIQVHPNGRFLYGSNRGANTLVVYNISPTNGQLTYVESISTLGKTPRHFALDPTGNWLLAENQDSSTVAVFRVDPKSGRLTPTGPLVPSRPPSAPSSSRCPNCDPCSHRRAAVFLFGLPRPLRFPFRQQGTFRPRA